MIHCSVEMPLNLFRLKNLLDARFALEVQLARLAAERRPEDDLAALTEALALMELEVGDGRRGTDGDERFHSVLTAAGHSDLLARFMNEISDLVREARMQSLGQPGRSKRSLQDHRPQTPFKKATETKRPNS